MDDLVEKALRLLRAMSDGQAYGISGVRVIPHQVAFHADLDTHSEEYKEAIDLLMGAGCLVQRQDEPGAYEITDRGIEVLRERRDARLH
jgi:hypothetical protein